MSKPFFYLSLNPQKKKHTRRLAMRGISDKFYSLRPSFRGVLAWEKVCEFTGA
jgi:hypothetical protein